MYAQMIKFLNDNFSYTGITRHDLNMITSFLSPYNTIKILEEIVKNEELLTKIESRSYTHALGFDKIVLADLSKDVSPDLPKAQIRLHIWDPENTNSLPIVESLHEHSFDFVSTVLCGYLENQQYSFNELSAEEERLLNHLLMWRELADPADVEIVDNHLEIIEAKRLEFYGSRQFDCMYNDYDGCEVSDSVDLICHKTGFLKHEVLDILINIQGHYVSNRVAGEKKSYKHILDKYAIIKPYDVLTILQGQSYHHPYQLPHRLFYDNTMLNSTILLTTPVESNPEGGSLQRPTYITKDEQDYNKISYKSGEWREKILLLIEHLRKIYP